MPPQFEWKPILDMLDSVLGMVLKHPVKFEIDPVEPTNIISGTSIGASYIPEENTIVITASTIIPGVRTFRNGDPGFPDDVSVEDIETFPASALYPIVTKMAELVLADALNTAIDRYSEDMFAKELEEDKKKDKE